LQPDAAIAVTPINSAAVRGKNLITAKVPSPRDRSSDRPHVIRLDDESIEKDARRSL
jgi:hypothetical protein